MNEKRVSKADILLVDDTPANLRLLSQMLMSQGYEVRAVTSGARALESVSASLPDLILLDIKMAEMNGYEVCQTLKAEERTRDVPVIFISALDDLHDKITAFNAGGVDYITKPFQLEEVLARTETHLRLHWLQQRLQEANEKMQNELELAGKMQNNFLPGSLPQVPGWEFTAVLKPARETSGDFYDVYNLPDGRIGILIADVVDKGVGAALFMVLCWSLVRTYAHEFLDNPAQVLKAANLRILEDTGGRQYATLFYGILDPKSGELEYSNAGHMPALLVSEADGSLRKMPFTGVPLGIFEDQDWANETITIPRGALLGLYTDGVTDAQAPGGEFFEEHHLLESIRARLGEAASQVQSGVLADIAAFSDGTDQFDDIALVILRRLP